MRLWRTNWGWKRRLLLLAAIPCVLPGLMMTAIELIAWAMPLGSPPALPPSALKVSDRNGIELGAFTNANGRWHFPEADPSPQRDWLDLALIAIEDHRMDRHRGVDWQAVIAAAWSNLSGKRRRGASTLAMQVMRLRHQRARTPGNKLIEMCEAIAWRKALGMDALLAEYRARAPFGGNIVGSEAAAWCYFGKSAKELSLGEAALLAGLPQNPERLRPDRFPEAAAQRRQLVLSAMLEAGFISPQQAQAPPVPRYPAGGTAWPRMPTGAFSPSSPTSTKNGGRATGKAAFRRRSWARSPPDWNNNKRLRPGTAPRWWWWISPPRKFAPPGAAVRRSGSTAASDGAVWARPSNPSSPPRPSPRAGWI